VPHLSRFFETWGPAREHRPDQNQFTSDRTFICNISLSLIRTSRGSAILTGIKSLTYGRGGARSLLKRKLLSDVLSIT
jgi:hypothetical protein